MVQAAGGRVMEWGIFSWSILEPLVPTEHPTVCLSVVADHNHTFITKYPSSNGFFQNNVPSNKEFAELLNQSSFWGDAVKGFHH